MSNFVLKSKIVDVTSPMLQDLLDWIDREDLSVPILQSNGFGVTEQGQTNACQPEVKTFCWLDEFMVPNDLSTSSGHSSSILSTEDPA